jgi:hypothetical protein
MVMEICSGGQLRTVAFIVHRLWRRFEVGVARTKYAYLIERIDLQKRTLAFSLLFVKLRSAHTILPHHFSHSKKLV